MVLFYPLLDHVEQGSHRSPDGTRSPLRISFSHFLFTSWVRLRHDSLRGHLIREENRPRKQCLYRQRCRPFRLDLQTCFITTSVMHCYPALSITTSTFEQDQRKRRLSEKGTTDTIYDHLSITALRPSTRTAA
ncbi:hypothetical protein BU26DRAFT_218437 [Trematosphaeria pertusa]|uniref:Uncharacterized protein n=1 Tax=Trematosphaeria pertusa TaxID=390896 RepID=A0A6A6IRN7_9PLEO|nr:uncharacterized protein BU26DRAFT_218437 [Trematosphaeria pertusa]KAF2253225.1 hypothetical protein BU26DRAFT_218437 [Trematosphaeria pertusa]